MSFAHGSQTVGLRGELRCERPDLLRFRVTDGVYVPRRRSSRLGVRSSHRDAARFGRLS